MPEKVKFYNKDWFIWIMLIFIAPVGILLLWKNKLYNKNIRIVITIFSVLIFIIMYSSDNNVENNNNEHKIEEVLEEDTPISPKELDIDYENVTDVNYILLWKEYTKDDEGKHVRFSGKIDSISGESINIKDNLEGLTGNVRIRFNDSNLIEALKEGDYVTITGKTGMKLMGQLHIDNAIIDNTGKLAKDNVDKIALEAQEKSKKQAEEILAKSIEDEMEYKKNAVSVNYNDLLREPYKYKDQIIKIEVEIAQVLSGGIITEEAYRGYQGENEWYISYKLPENTPRIIEDDVVIFYGEFDDLTTITRGLTGIKDDVPRIKAKYHK